MSANIQNVPEVNEFDLSLKCTTDLSALQYTFVKIAAGVVAACGAGENAIGILMNAPVGTSSKPATAQVRPVGLAKLVLGGTVSGGGLLKSDASGKGVAASTNHDRFCAVTIDDGVSGDIAAVILNFGTISA